MCPPSRFTCISQIPLPPLPRSVDIDASASPHYFQFQPCSKIIWHSSNMIWRTGIFFHLYFLLFFCFCCGAQMHMSAKARNQNKAIDPVIRVTRKLNPSYATFCKNPDRQLLPVQSTISWAIDRSAADQYVSSWSLHAVLPREFVIRETCFLKSHSGRGHRRCCWILWSWISPRGVNVCVCVLFSATLGACSRGYVTHENDFKRHG